MLKAVLAGAAALAIAGTSVVYAQQHQGRWADSGRRGQPPIEDMRAYADARLAALKAGLELTPDQEKNWPAFEQAARDLAKLRFDRLAARRDRIQARREARRNELQTQQSPQSAPVDPIERLRERGTAMAETGTALKNLADATDPLYKSLNDSQKRRFAVLGRMDGLRDMRSGLRGRSGRGMMRWRERRSELMPERSGRARQFFGRHHRWNDEGYDRGNDRDRDQRSGSSDSDNGGQNL